MRMSVVGPSRQSILATSSDHAVTGSPLRERGIVATEWNRVSRCRASTSRTHKARLSNTTDPGEETSGDDMISEVGSNPQDFDDHPGEYLYEEDQDSAGPFLAG